LAAVILSVLFLSSSFLPGRACVSTVPGGQPISI